MLSIKTNGFYLTGKHVNTGVLACLALCLVLVLAGLQAAPASAWGPAAKTKTPKAGNGGGPGPGEVLSAVNAIRTGYGLPAFQSNGALMSAAQTQSNYQASIGSASHSGAGGSDPKGRALAAGYGGGADISVIENIYSGMNASAQQAVNWWQGDSLHLATITSNKHSEAGAGVAVGSDGTVYITLVVGAVVGGEAPAASTGSTGSGAAGGATGSTAGATAGAAAGSALQQSTPNPDGSIVHVVEAGQSLWTIAAIYKVDFNELLTLNNLYPTSFIRPGQKITIRPAGEQPSPTPEGSPTPAPTRTPRPTATATKPGTAAAVLAATQGGVPIASSGEALSRGSRKGIDPVLVGIGLLVFAGLALLVAGNVLKRVG